MKINNATTLDILASLRKYSESTSAEGAQIWGMVYIDNARPSYLNPHQFAAHLSILEGKGLYRKCSEAGYAGVFGEVELTQEATYGAPDSSPLFPAVSTEEAFRGLGAVYVP